jgi:hypothetical protein
MQANEDNENENDALEGLALVNEENPYVRRCTNTWREQFLNSILVKEEKSSLYKHFSHSNEAYSRLEDFVSNKLNV